MWSPAPSWYVSWSLDGRDLTIHLYLHVVDWLSEELSRSLKPGGKAGEARGILLGRIEPRARPEITIEGLAPLSSPDKQHLKEQLAKWKREDGRNVYAIGYYRSHRRREFELHAGDYALANECFANSENIFLLINRSPAGGSTGGFFLPQGRPIRKEPDLLFPLSRSLLRARETEARPVREEAAQLSAPEEAPPKPRISGSQPSLQENAPDRQRNEPLQPLPSSSEPTLATRRIVALLTTGILILLSVAAVIALRQNRGAGKETAVDLGLMIEKEDTILRLSWNKKSPLIQSATEGALRIRDGVLEKNVVLDSGRLRSAYYLYPNLTDEVSFRLNVVTAGRIVTQSLLMVGAGRASSNLPPASRPEMDPREARPLEMPVPRAQAAAKPSAQSSPGNSPLTSCVPNGQETVGSC
jgi:hypothetical protein